jgi:hypothetical protein
MDRRICREKNGMAWSKLAWSSACRAVSVVRGSGRRSRCFTSSGLRIDRKEEARRGRGRMVHEAAGGAGDAVNGAAVVAVVLVRGGARHWEQERVTDFINFESRN